MSLRRSKATEAISDVLEKLEIAALPSVARNDENPIMTQSLTTEGQGEGGLGEAWRSTLFLMPSPLPS